MAILDKIHEAEEQADEILKNAKEEARTILESAKQSALSKQRQLISEKKEANQKELEKYKDKTNERFVVFLVNKEKESLEKIKEADKKIDKAADYILEQIIS